MVVLHRVGHVSSRCQYFLSTPPPQKKTPPLLQPISDLGKANMKPTTLAAKPLQIRHSRDGTIQLVTFLEWVIYLVISRLML